MAEEPARDSDAGSEEEVVLTPAQLIRSLQEVKGTGVVGLVTYWSRGAGHTIVLVLKSNAF